MSDTTRSMIPQLRVVAEKMITSIEMYPSTPYTKDNLDCLDRVMFLIERAEGHHEGVALHVSSQAHGDVREGHGEGQASVPGGG